MEGCKSELDLFCSPGIQTSIKSSEIFKVTPLTKVNGIDGSIEFNIISQNGRYIDLASTLMEIFCRLQFTDGTNIPKNYNMFPEKNALHSMFNSVEIWLNETKVSSSNNLYPYRAYFTNTLNYNKELKETLLLSEGYCDIDDWPSSFKTATRRDFTFYGRPHADLFFQDRLILPGVNIRIKFNRSPEGFAVVDAETRDEEESALKDKTLCMNILDMSLHVRMVELQPHKEQAMELALSRQNALYPIKRIEMRSLSITPGMRSYRFDNIITGVLPVKVIFGVVNHAAALGNEKMLAFDFGTHNLKEVSLLKNGASAGIPFTVENDSGDPTPLAMRAYNALFSSAGCSGLSGHGITYQEFTTNTALFCYDLTPDDSSLDHSFLSPASSGTLSLKLDFNKNTVLPYNVIVLCEFDNNIKVDRLRNIIIDY